MWQIVEEIVDSMFDKQIKILDFFYSFLWLSFGENDEKFNYIIIMSKLSNEKF